jgi:excisionase family DNA binding protein
MYAGIRQYQMSPELSAVVSQQLERGLTPLLMELPGFVAYYVVDAGDGVLLTVRIFEDRAGVEEFDKIAMGWVEQNIEVFFSEIAKNAPHLLASIPDLLTELEAEFLGPARGGAKELLYEEASGPANREDLQLLSVEEVSVALGMGKSWVYQRIRSGEIPSVKLGGSVKVLQPDLEEFLGKNRRYQSQDKR